MSESDATPDRLYRAARRELGDTSDAIWTGNDDDYLADARLLARHYLSHSLFHREQAAMTWLFSGDAEGLTTEDAKRIVRDRFGEDVARSIREKYSNLGGDA